MCDRISNNFFSSNNYLWLPLAKKPSRRCIKWTAITVTSSGWHYTDLQKRLHRASGFWLRKKDLFYCTSRLIKRDSMGMFYNFMAKTSAGAELKIGLKILARSTRPKFPMLLLIFYLRLETSITHA